MSDDDHFPLHMISTNNSFLDSHRFFGVYLKGKCFGEEKKNIVMSANFLKILLVI